MGPVDLEGEDPQLFQAFLNCVYFGSEILEQWADATEAEAEAETEAKPEGKTSDEKQAGADLVFEKLIGLYLLAERLVDFKTANMVIDEMIRAREVLNYIPTQGPVSLAYASTVKGSPLCTLIRDFWIYDSIFTDTDRGLLRAPGFPSECARDIAFEVLGISRRDQFGSYKSVKTICFAQVCLYHQHDELHPKCVSAESGMCHTVLLLWKTLKANTPLPIQTLEAFECRVLLGLMVLANARPAVNGIT